MDPVQPTPDGLLTAEAAPAEPPKPDTEPNALVVKWQERIRRSRKRSKKHRKRIERNRKMLRGQMDPDAVDVEDDDSEKARANLLYATMRGLLPHLYARNPEISVQQSPAVDLERDAWVPQFASTLEVGVNRQISDSALKSVGKRVTRSSLATRVGWAKVSLQGGDIEPQIQARINDTMDNIERVSQLRQALEGDQLANEDEQEATLEELQHTLAGLQAQAEISSAYGIVIEHVPPEHIEVDGGIHALEDYPHAHWIAQRLYITKERAKGMFAGVDLEQATLFGVDRDDETDDSERFSRVTTSKVRADEDAYFCVWEIWAKTDQSVYTMIDGVRQWVREPFQPQNLGERWYPFFGLMLLPSEDWYPMDIVELLEELQREYNDARDKLAAARDASQPGIVVSAEVSEDSVRRVSNARTGDITIVDTKGQPLRDMFAPAPDPTINPAIFDTQGILSDIQWVSGLQDAERGGVTKSKTATEAEILQSGLVSRTGEMQDTTEDWVGEIAKYIGEIMLQVFTPAQMQRLAGPSAVWPQMRKDDVFELVDLEVRAGTSGKPNKQREQQQWIQFSAMLQQTVLAIRQLMAVGQDFTPEVELLRETARRFDERLDIEKFIPKPPQLPPALPGVGGGLDPALAQQLPPELAGQLEGGGEPQAPPIGGGQVQFQGAGI